ncbi:MAG: VCBS repeat-containing protein [Planctomycetota bacterium]
MKEHKLFLLIVFISSIFLSDPDVNIGAGLYAEKIPSQFSQQSIEIKGTVNDVILKDLNNDGIQEILFQQNRDLIIYVLQSSTGESLIQNSIYHLPDDVCMFGIVNKQGLIYVSSKGISSLPIELNISGKKLQPITSTLLFPTSTIFRDEVFDVPLHKNFIFNLDKDKSMMVIPDTNKFFLVNDTYQAEEIHLPMTSNIYWNNSSIFEPLITEASLPYFVFADLNNDKYNDFIVLKQNKIYGYLLNEPDQSDSRAGKEKQKFKDIGCLLDASESDSQLIKDINNDSCADVICANNNDGTIYIYLNRYSTLRNNGANSIEHFYALSPTLYSNTPTQIIRTNSWIIKNDLIDLNNDSLNDLVLVQMNKLGIMGGLQAILGQMLEWEIAVYLARPTQNTSTSPYPKSPDYIRTMKLPFSFSYAGPLLVGKRSEIKIQIPHLWNLEGDFNGDGIKDLLISGVKDGSLEIYLGDKSQIFSRSLSASIDLLSVNKKFKLAGKSYISDINNDGKSDIIIPYDQENPDKSISHFYEILLSH